MPNKKLVSPRFNFCGSIVIPKRNGSWVKRDSFGRSEKISINFGIKNGSNIAYVTAQNFKNDPIKTRDTDGAPIEIKWDDRFDADVVKTVSSASKYVVNLGERKEFITAWDMIEYLEAALAGYADDIVCTGRYVIRPGVGQYAGQYFKEFQLQNVYSAGENAKHRLAMNLDLYYDRDSMDTSSLKDNGKIYMNCYTSMWINKDEGNKMVPVQVVFNTAAFNMDSPREKAKYESNMGYLTTKSRNPVHMNWELGVVNGAEEVHFDESCLTKAQKRQIELGFSTLEDFRPRGTIFGERVNELRINKPLLMGEFADCETAAQSDYTAREFEEMIYIPSKEETVEDMMKSGASKSTHKDEDDERDLDSIF
jgi:hypothetical protein